MPTLQRFRVDGMMCEGCVKTLRSALSQDPNILDLDISLPHKTVAMYVVPDTTTNGEIIARILDAGFDATDVTTRRDGPH